VPEDDQERTPPSVSDAPGKVVALEHVGHLQILMIGRIVLAYQRKRCLVAKILPLASLLLVCIGEQDNRFLAAMTSFLAPRGASQCGLERPLFVTIPDGA
jgi:hypothetical protein